MLDAQEMSAVIHASCFINARMQVIHSLSDGCLYIGERLFGWLALILYGWVSTARRVNYIKNSRDTRVPHVVFFVVAVVQILVLLS